MEEEDRTSALQKVVQDDGYILDLFDDQICQHNIGCEPLPAHSGETGSFG